MATWSPSHQERLSGGGDIWVLKEDTSSPGSKVGEKHVGFSCRWTRAWRLQLRKSMASSGYTVACCDRNVVSGPILKIISICILCFARLHVKVCLTPNPTYNYAIKLVKCSPQPLLMNLPQTRADSIYSTLVPFLTPLKSGCICIVNVSYSASWYFISHHFELFLNF